MEFKKIIKSKMRDLSHKKVIHNFCKTLGIKTKELEEISIWKLTEKVNETNREEFHNFVNIIGSSFKELIKKDFDLFTFSTVQFKIEDEENLIKLYNEFGLTQEEFITKLEEDPLALNYFADKCGVKNEEDFFKFCDKIGFKKKNFEKSITKLEEDPLALNYIIKTCGINNITDFVEFCDKIGFKKKNFNKIFENADLMCDLSIQCKTNSSEDFEEQCSDIIKGIRRTKSAPSFFNKKKKEDEIKQKENRIKRLSLTYSSNNLENSIKSIKKVGKTQGITNFFNKN